MKIKNIIAEAESKNYEKIRNVVYNVLQSYLSASKNEEASERIMAAIKKVVK